MLSTWMTSSWHRTGFEPTISPSSNKLLHFTHFLLLLFTYLWARSILSRWIPGKPLELEAVGAVKLVVLAGTPAAAEAASYRCVPGRILKGFSKELKFYFKLSITKPLMLFYSEIVVILIIYFNTTTLRTFWSGTFFSPYYGNTIPICSETNEDRSG